MRKAPNISRRISFAKDCRSPQKIFVHAGNRAPHPADVPGLVLILINEKNRRKLWITLLLQIWKTTQRRWMRSLQTKLQIRLTTRSSRLTSRIWLRRPLRTRAFMMLKLRTASLIRSMRHTMLSRSSIPDRMLV